ncbi:MAG: hypothetical protein AB7L65_01620 [Hyphomonadaceae bacterium]
MAKIEGEGSYTGTKDYNKRTKEFLDREGADGVEHLAEDAADALDSTEGEALRKAEAEGLKHAKKQQP